MWFHLTLGNGSGKNFNYATIKLSKGHHNDLMKAQAAFQYLLNIIKLNFRLYLVRELEHLNR